MPALEVSAVRAGYGRTEVLHGVDLRVPAGKAVVLLGPNGVGKSTLLRTIAGLVPVRSGSIRLQGEPVERRPPTAALSRASASSPKGGGSSGVSRYGRIW